ncbi:MAG: CTP synthase, partial [Chlamydiae bacterium]|nr:CTP synthase [Chlamydiota bacterium]
MNNKFIFITGGVLSSIGKGITSACIANLLESKGLKVAICKLDPYLNVDPGTMNPFEHGEVYVTDDGSETDLDLGHYNRFSNSPLSKASNTTSGQIFDTVIRKERRGEFLGKTVQVVPHITDEIKSRIIAASKQQPDIAVTIIEIGGTVGDIESGPFLEAIRQFRNEHPRDCINIHIVYIPFLISSGEIKTKPAQHSMQMLREKGIFCDIILCRTEAELSTDIKEKIALFCSVPKDGVFEVVDVKKSIYEVPINLKKEGLEAKISSLLHLEEKPSDTLKWETMLHRLFHPIGSVNIAIVGKYLQHKDAYKSVFEALIHAGIAHQCEVKIECIESDKIESLQHFEKLVSGCDGILVPGGFGERGVEGKILAAQYAREHNIPYFGICLGMQVMVIEYARNVLGLKEAHSTEMVKNAKDPVICLISEQKHILDLGGTMRLGAYSCHLEPDSKSFEAYGKSQIFERHRHRYEFNNEYKKALQEKGLKIAG